MENVCFNDTKLQQLYNIVGSKQCMLKQRSKATFSQFTIRNRCKLRATTLVAVTIRLTCETLPSLYMNSIYLCEQMIAIKLYTTSYANNV